MSDANARFGVAALILGAVCIGFAPILVRLSEVGPVATAFHRLLWSVPIFALAVLIQRAPVAHSPRTYAGMALSGLFFAGDLTVWHIGIILTSVANATLFSNTAPVFVTLGAWVLWGLRPSRRFAAALVVAMAGAFLLMGASFRLSLDRLAGDAFSLASGAFYGAYLLSVGRLRARIPTPLLMAVGAAVGAVPVLGVAWLLDETIWPRTVQGWAVVAGLALLGQVAGQGLIAWGLAHVPSAFGSLVLLVQPVVAAIVAWFLFGEALGPQEWLGALVVLAGIQMARRAKSP